MHWIPARNELRTFLFFVIGLPAAPATVLVILTLLPCHTPDTVPHTPFLTWIAVLIWMAAYCTLVVPPFLLSMLFLSTQRYADSVHNVLFDASGYVLVSPTPLGFAYCAIFWMLVGYTIWLMLTWIRASKR